MTVTISRRSFTALLTTSLLAGAARGEDYPTRSIRMICPFPGGQTTDLVGRLYAEQLGDILKESVFVQNEPGAGGTIGWATAARATPDGYTITVVNSSLSISPALHPDLPYDPAADFAPIALVGESPLALIVHPSMGVKNLREFIALTKANPNKFYYGSAGVGTSTHLAGAYFCSLAGVSMVHVPFKAEQLVTEVMAGRVQATFAPPAFLLSQIKDGSLLALAVASHQPFEEPVHIPTFDELGLPGYFYATWYGFAAPAHVPPPIINRLIDAVKQAGRTPNVIKRFHDLGVLRQDLFGKEFGDYIKADMTRLIPLMKQSVSK